MKGNLSRKHVLRKQLHSIFSGKGSVTFFETRFAGQAVDLAFEALSTGHHVLVAVGGDGTLNEVINGVMSFHQKYARLSMDHIRLGLLPAGSGNDFARTLKLTSDPALLLSWMEQDQWKKIYPGSALTTNSRGEKSKRYFVNVADAGLGAAVVERMDAFRWMGSLMSYQFTTIKTLLSFKKQQAVVRINGKENYNGPLMSLVIAKGKYFGNGLGIAPHAEPNAQSLAAVVIGKVSIFDYLLQLRNILRLHSIKHAEVSYSHAETVELYAEKSSIAVELDGEFAGYAPVTFSQGNISLCFLCPI